MNPGAELLALANLLWLETAQHERRCALCEEPIRAGVRFLSAWATTRGPWSQSRQHVADVHARCALEALAEEP